MNAEAQACSSEFATPRSSASATSDAKQAVQPPEPASNPAGASLQHERVGSKAREADLSPADSPEANNYRDIATVTGPVKFRWGRFFRSSQMHSPELRQELGITTLIDLRKSEKACKKWVNKGRSVMHPTWIAHRARRRLPQRIAPRCPICEKELNKNGVDYTVQVRHIDLTTTRFKLKVFGELPRRAAGKAAGLAMCGGDPDKPTTGVVADPDQFGYSKLYQMILQHSKPTIARAMRLLADDSLYPMMAFCVHGKDRTGIIVMLVLRLCGVPYDAILQDYIASAHTMQRWAQQGQPELSPELQADDVLSADREYMIAAFDFIKREHGDVPEYLCSCGITAQVQAAIRANLVAEPSAAPGPADGAPDQRG